MIREQEKLPQQRTTPPLATERQHSLPETVFLRPQSQIALQEILGRQDNKAQQSAEDVVAQAIDIFNVLTRHVSQKDSKVILHTVGQSLKTLNLPNYGGAKPVFEKEILPPKMSW